VQQVPVLVTVQSTVMVTRVVEVTRVVTATPQPTPTAVPTVQRRAQVIYAPLDPSDESWKYKPAVPRASQKMKEVYARGLALGNDPRIFSKIGDCNSSSDFFLEPFDRPGQYNLGPYAELQIVIDHFNGSFGLNSMAARTGFGPNSMFVPLWSDPHVCQSGEGPLPCEYRLRRPSIALIGLGTHYQPLPQFEAHMRAVIEFFLDRGVVPILATKVDNEGGNEVNATIGHLAREYDVPLWNFWFVMQAVPNLGQPDGDGIHFTWAENDFSSADALSNGWPVRNLSALKVLNSVWEDVRLEK